MKRENKSDTTILRQKAEELLKKKASKSRPQLSEGEMLKFNHELEVHQIELEMQNEELFRAKEQAVIHAAIEKSADEVSIFAENIINTVREPLLALDQDLRVVKANRSFYNFFKVTAGETIGNLIYDLGNNQWDIPKLRELLETILPEKTTFDDYEVEHNFSTIGKRVMLLNARQIKRAFGKEKIILLAIEDITERKLAEELLSEKNRMTGEYLDILLNNAHAPIIIWDSSLVIRRFNREFEKLSGYKSTEVIDQKIDILFPEPKIESTLELLNNHLSDEELKVIEVDILTKGNDIKTVLWNSANILDQEGTNTVATIAQDITRRKRTEEALRISDEKYRGIFENILDVYFVTSIDGTIHEVSPSIEIISKGEYHRDDLIGKSMQDLYAITGGRQTLLKSLQESGSVSDYEIILKNRDGSNMQCSITAKIQFDVFGKPLKIVGSLRDITERKRTENALLESEIKYRAFFENSMDAILLTSPDGKIQSANQAACSMFGYSEAELKKLGRSGVVDASDPRLSVLLTERNLKGKAQGEITLKRKDGTLFPGEISSAIFKNTEGFECTSMIIRDITERKKTEKEIWNLAKFPSENPNPILRIAQNGILLYVNEAGMKQLPDWKLQTEQSAPNILQDVVFNTMNIGEVQVVEFEHSEKVYSFYVVPIVEEGYANLYGWDITERKQAEKEITVLAHSLKSINECVSITDLDDKILFVNESFLKTYGYTLNELIGKNISMVRSQANEQKQVDEILSATISGEWQGELWNKRKDGTEFPIYLSTSIIKDKESKVLGLIGVATDITERMRADETLLKLSSAIEQTVDSIMITDRDGTIEYVNHAFEILTGYTSVEAVGKTPRILKSGTKDQNYYKELWETILSGKVFKEEVVNKRKNGVLYDEEKTISPIYNQNKTITHFIGTGVDITRRKLAETELIEAKEKAEESDRLKSAFLANMSHEVRTPLNSIIGFSELLADPFFEDQKTEFIQSIITSGNNLLTIISDIMDFSKMESGEIAIRRSQINALKFILIIKEQFAIQIEGKKLEFKLTHPDNEEDTVIFADIERLRQIFNNLLSNAIKFTMNGSIEIGYQPKGKMVEFYVKDTGIGIPAEYHDSIFERFRQVEAGNSRKYGGNGLGLAISKNLVELMGGKIWLESEFGKGSVFYFTLPAYNS